MNEFIAYWENNQNNLYLMGLSNHVQSPEPLYFVCIDWTGLANSTEGV